LINHDKIGIAEITIVQARGMADTFVKLGLPDLAREQLAIADKARAELEQAYNVSETAMEDRLDSALSESSE
jgi:hypothetical protein